MSILIILYGIGKLLLLKYLSDTVILFITRLTRLSRVSLHLKPSKSISEDSVSSSPSKSDNLCRQMCLELLVSHHTNILEHDTVEVKLDEIREALRESEKTGVSINGNMF